VRTAGQGSGGAQQVMRDGGAGQPGRVRGEGSGQIGQWPVGPVGEDLFYDRVVAVLGFGLDGERGIGEHRVVASGGEQLVRPGRPAYSGRGPGARSAGR
jgi:hypothetical protein